MGRKGRRSGGGRRVSLGCEGRREDDWVGYSMCRRVYKTCRIGLDLVR